jgi:ribosome biogenesis GTPase
METLRGIVIRSQSGFFTIETKNGEIMAQLRGRLKKGKRTGDIIAVGDWVKVSIHPDGTAMIEDVEERKNAFVRMAPSARGIYEQVIIANPDKVVFVFSCDDPPPNLRMLDRFLIIAESQRLPLQIVANKLDLVSRREAKYLFGHYPKLGYPVLYTSVVKKRGIRELKKLFKNKISVLIGPSGVGKSSLLNAIQPGLGLEVRSVSEATGRGRHTTVVRQMFKLESGGYVADTPGLKTLPLWDLEPEEIDGYFPELAALVAHCQFSNCTHTEEPSCAVLEALERGKIHPERYESYLRIRFGDSD